MAITSKEHKTGSFFIKNNFEGESWVKKLDTGDGGAVVSVLKNQKRYYLVVVNRDFQAPMTLSIETDKTVKRVMKNGTITPVRGSSEIVEVEPGDVVIYTWGK